MPVNICFVALQSVRPKAFSLEFSVSSVWKQVL